jgi:cytochrome P450
MIQAVMSLPLGAHLVPPILRQLRKGAVFEFTRFAAEKVDARIAQGSTARPDFMSRVLENNRDDGTGITRLEINATTVVLVIAGSETTATLLSGATYLLCRNPEALKKARAEVDAAFGSKEDITIQSASHLTYLPAVLEESLRMYPPVPISLVRQTPKGGTSICGRWIPGNVSSRLCVNML